jgi:hypothetical protein
MSFTGTDVLTTARELANDADSSTWNDTTALNFINSGVRFLYRECPDSRINTDGSIRNYAALSALSETVGLDDIFILPLAEFYLWQFFDSDSGDSRDKERAQRHYNTLMAFMRPV